MARLLALVLVAFVGCSSSDGGAGGAVASTPLSGTFRGASFAGKRAHATRASPSQKLVDIVEADVGCADSAKQKQGILVTVTWQTGYARDFPGDGTTLANAVLYYEENGTPKNEVVSGGRVELVESSPEKGSKGRLRIRALTGSSDLEGEVPLEVCD